MKVPEVGNVLFPGSLDLVVTRVEGKLVVCENERGNYEIPTSVFEHVDLTVQSGK